jgi:hypothetical protein
MSYPQLHHCQGHISDFVIFTVPNHQVIQKITRDRDQELNLRVRAAANTLSPGISELKFLLSTFSAELVSPYGQAALQVKLGTDSMTLVSRENKKQHVDRKLPYAQLPVYNTRVLSSLSTIPEEPVECQR